MKLIASVIGRNEVNNVEGMIRSIRSTIDALVYLDTGSMDNTPGKVEGICRSLGIKCLVKTSSWHGSFAHARNEGLDLLKEWNQPVEEGNTWILFLDCDERLDSKYRDLKSLGAKARDKGVDINDVGGFMTPIYSPHTKIHAPIDYLADSTIRIFRFRDDIRFTGDLHEQIMPAITRAGLLWLNTPITIHHLGYDLPAEAQMQKLVRNASITWNALQQDPGNGLLYYNYANTMSVMGRHVDAIKSFRLALGNGLAIPQAQCRAMTTIGLDYAVRLDNVEKGVYWLEKARSIWQEDENCNYWLARLYQITGNSKFDSLVEEIKKKPNHRVSASQINLLNTPHLPQKKRGKHENSQL